MDGIWIGKFDSRYVEDSQVHFLAKFGKKKHLERIIKGKIRFSPAQFYIEQEEKTNIKGQGDLFEGKMRIPTNVKAKLYDQKSGMLLQERMLTAGGVVNFDSVSSMPICCFYAGTTDECMLTEAKKEVFIRLLPQNIETIRKDFNNPEAVLLIFNPQDYICDMKRILNVEASGIHYFDLDKLPLQYFSFLCNGKEEISWQDFNNATFRANDKYRALLCKDVFFKNQKEYRFIKIDEAIETPKEYDFPFHYQYRLILSEEFFEGIKVNLL